MSKRKPNVVDIRMDDGTLADVERLQPLGKYAGRARSEFLGYLIWLGTKRYPHVLKVEIEDDEFPRTGRGTPPAPEAENG